MSAHYPRLMSNVWWVHARGHASTWTRNAPMGACCVQADACPRAWTHHTLLIGLLAPRPLLAISGVPGPPRGQRWTTLVLRQAMFGRAGPPRCHVWPVWASRRPHRGHDLSMLGLGGPSSGLPEASFGPILGNFGPPPGHYVDKLGPPRSHIWPRQASPRPLVGHLRPLGAPLDAMCWSSGAFPRTPFGRAGASSRPFLANGGPP